jgi:hypothetical protein
MGGGAPLSRNFEIRLDALDHSLKNFDTRARTAIGAAMKYQAARSETWMRTNARWTDRTTNARNGLFATVLEEGTDVWLLVLSHSVSYGIWLEVANSGRYAIVRPAWLRANRELMQLISKLFERMEKAA